MIRLFYHLDGQVYEDHYEALMAAVAYSGGRGGSRPLDVFSRLIDEGVIVVHTEEVTHGV